ncbi:MAG: glycine cleavage system protein H [Gammaproteobacteria bacterium]|nr:MAG: glycine cleavage system protein H [Gammaproteobacteria bacterium]
MSNLPSELRYLSSHEWVRVEDDGTAVVGITDHAQNAMGDLVFVETPEVGSTVSATEEAGVVESVKAASDIYAPLSGEIVAVNEALEDSPETVNQDPYGDGWMFRIKLSDPSELDKMLSAEDYEALVSEED